MNIYPDEFEEHSEASPLPEDPPSKSQKKRDASRSVDMAKALLELSQRKREHFKLTSEINDALELGDNIRSNSARKRQLHYIGKLLRNSPDYEVYLQKYSNPKQLVEAAITDGRIAEKENSEDQQIRNRLIDDLAGTMPDLRTRYPNANIQLIRQLVNRIHKHDNEHPDASDGARAKLLKALDNALLEASA